MDEAAFPPLPSSQANLARLVEMFPSVDKAVVDMVLEGVRGEVEEAMELLLGMAPASASIPEVEEVVSLAKAASIIESPRRAPPAPLEEGVRAPLRDLDEGFRVMAIMRGLPGSGKSTLAQRLAVAAGLGELLSADDFFLDGRGRYTFQPARLPEAHAENQRRVAAAVARGVRLVVVDNTNTMAWEMRPYITLAVDHGYKVHLLEPATAWRFKPRQLAMKTLHSVPQHKIQEMLERYQKNINLDCLIREWSLPSKKATPKVSEEIVTEELVDASNEDAVEITDLVKEETVDEEAFSTSDSQEAESSVERETGLRLVDYSASSDEEFFMSDEEEAAADVDDEPELAAVQLNPHVAEFVPLASREASPLTVEGGLALATEEQVVAWDRGVGELLEELRLGEGEGDTPPAASANPAPALEPDISHLLAMFPHLSLGQLETLYMVHKGSTTEVVAALLDQDEEDEANTLDLVPKTTPSIPGSALTVVPRQPPAATSVSDAASTTGSDAEASVKMTLDPRFAVGLQEELGSPVDESLLNFFTTDEFLEVELPHSLAMELFACWRRSLHTKLSSKDVLKSSAEKVGIVDRSVGSLLKDLRSEAGQEGAPPPGAAPPPARAHAAPRTVLAPNAVEYYEGRMVERAVEASLVRPAVQHRPRVVVAAPRTEGEVAREEEGLEEYIRQRDELYRKARASSKIQGVAGYYAAEARTLNARIKARQREAQLQLFEGANRDRPPTSLDLHYLQTGDAVKQLNAFVAERLAGLRRGQVEVVEVVTGKGNRSENGKSRLKPAVANWLEQKKFTYSESNPGCLRVQLRNS